MDLLLKNLRWYDGATNRYGDVRISKGVFCEIGSNLFSKKNEHVCDFEGHFIYPGLINAHDHLEMNLYPKLGTPPFANYVEWANDIYKPRQSPIQEIEKLPIKDRLLWGGIKNLISGATTVVHHNPWHRFLGKDEFPVKVLKKIAWAHSLQFGKKIEREFPKKIETPFVIHAAEGIDAFSFSEISALDNLGLIKNNTVIIHAIAVSQTDISLLTRNQSSVVWCPASNYFMFNQTAPVDKLRGSIRLALGSDSTLTGSPTLLDEIRVAIGTNYVTSDEIFRMITASPANIFNLPPPRIAPLSPADFFITPIANENYFENLAIQQPKDIKLIVRNGRPRLATGNEYKTLKNLIRVQGALKHTDIEIASLKERIEKKVGCAILELNPLWNLITAA